MNKVELAAHARGLGVEVEQTDTKADIQRKIDALSEPQPDPEAQPEAEPEAPAPLPEVMPEPEPAHPATMRAKVNRGSNRRIQRAKDDLDGAFERTIAELDRQLFTADENGNRIGRAPVVVWLEAQRRAFDLEVQKILKG
jgi:hypothetical protein